jgi:hypothetical protein
MTYEEYGTNSQGEKIFARIDDDGLIRYTCLEADPNYQAWLKDQEASN